MSLDVSSDKALVCEKTPLNVGFNTDSIPLDLRQEFVVIEC
jgi:hypothetical protein